MTVWFTDQAVQAWRAPPPTTRGGQRWDAPLAILTVVTLQAVLRLALRQAEGLIGFVIGLLGLTLNVPGHSTLSRRAETLRVPRPRPRPPKDGEPLHLLVDGTDLKLCGAGEWLLEEHGAEVGPLMDQVQGLVASFTAARVYDQESISAVVARRHPEAAIIVPPRSTAVPSGRTETAPTQRGHHLQSIAAHGRVAWQKASGATKRSRAEAAIGRFKRVIGDGLRSRKDMRRATEVGVAIRALSRMLELERPTSARVA